MPQRAPRAELLGLGFDPVDMGAAVSTCLAWCEAPRTPHTVITANAAILCMMRRDEELRRSCTAGDLVLADGMSVVWASRILGAPVPERVPGVDLMARLLEAAGPRRLRVYFLGARRQVVEELAARSAARHAGLVVAGARDGYFPPSDHARVAEEVRAAAPHLLFVGMPSPFKETWCERYRGLLDVPVIMGVGGSFDVLAGHVRRAPRLFQAAGMEWSWRLLMEPRKMWRRYLTTNAEFLGLVWRAWRARRSALPAPGDAG